MGIAKSGQAALRLSPAQRDLPTTGEERRPEAYPTPAKAKLVARGLRARIVLMAATGMADRAIALEVGCGPGTVSKWRRRFARKGMVGLADAPRRGKRKTADAAPKRELPKGPDQPRLDQLLDAANTASTHVRNVYVTFLLFGLYLAITFGSTTHEQLLRTNPVTLPLLNVELPLLGFYWVAPTLFVLLHLNLLLLLYLLSGKLHRLEGAISEATEQGHLTRERDEDVRAQIYPFTFSQMLIGRQHGRLIWFLLRLMMSLTVLVLPMVLLLAGQVRFLPYHDAATTIWHHILVFADAGLMLIFWRAIRHPEDRLSLHPGRWLWHQGKMLFGTLAALVLSLLIFTFPGAQGDLGDPMEEWLLGVVPKEWILEPRRNAPVFLPTGLLQVFGILSRNLVVTEANLVSSWPTSAQIDQYGEDRAWQNFGAPPNLRGRDLRYADLYSSIFVHGDFEGAHLEGALLGNANLQGANLQQSDLRVAFLGYANLQDANLSFANLQGADLWLAQLQGADLQQSDLQRARLKDANLQGASLSFADLQGVDLTGAHLQGANLPGAKLQGADLLGANLRGADLSQATLQGATLGSTDLQGANLSFANLRGAYLFGAHLEGADLAADLQGADLRRAHLWRAVLDRGLDLSDRWALVDLQGADVDPIADPESWIKQATEEIVDEATRSRVEKTLWATMVDDDRSERPRFTEARELLSGLVSDLSVPLRPPFGWDVRSAQIVDAYDEKLASFLRDLICDAEASAQIAQGVARRASYAIQNEPDRLFPKRLAERVTGDDCLHAAQFTETMRRQLEPLAALE